MDDHHFSKMTNLKIIIIIIIIITGAPINGVKCWWRGILYKFILESLAS
jgi:hypothetical protein